MLSTRRITCLFLLTFSAGAGADEIFNHPIRLEVRSPEPKITLQADPVDFLDVWADRTIASVHDFSLHRTKFPERVKTVVGPQLLGQTSYGLAVLDLTSGNFSSEEYVNPDQVVYPASSIKTLVAVAVLRLVDQKKHEMSEPIKIVQPNLQTEAAQTKNKGDYFPDKSVTIEKLLTNMIIDSNNVATNQLIDVATTDFINQTAHDLKAPSLKVIRKMWYDLPKDFDPTGPRNEATARGLIAMYREIATGRLEVLSEESRKFLLKILKHDVAGNRLDNCFPEGKSFYHKTGSTSDSTSDAGFFFIDDSKTKVAIVVGLQNFRYIKIPHSCSEGFTLLQKIGRIAYEELVGPVPSKKADPDTAIKPAANLNLHPTKKPR